MKLPPFPSKFVKATSPQIIQARDYVSCFGVCAACNMCAPQERQRQLEQILNAALAVRLRFIAEQE